VRRRKRKGGGKAARNKKMEETIGTGKEKKRGETKEPKKLC